MGQYNGKSRYSDEAMRNKIEKMNDEERENLIKELGVTHSVFENWMARKYKLVNSKVRNKCLHLIGLLINYNEFRELVEE